MTVRCIKCKAKLSVPDDKASPRLKLKCPGCKLVFPLSKAPRVGSTARAGKARPRAGAAVRPAGARAAGAAGAAAATANAAPAAAPRPDPPTSGAIKRGGWKKCVHHPRVDSENVCPACLRGYCRECGKRVHAAVICDTCEEILCIRAWEMKERQERERRRARPLRDEFEEVVKYPLTDVVAYIMLAVVVGFFAYTAGFGGFARIAFLKASFIHDAILMWYGFNAIVKVANGNRKLTLPEFRDASDIFIPLILAFAAWLATWGPVLIVIFVSGALLLMATPLASVDGALAIPDGAVMAGLLELPAGAGGAPFAAAQIDDSEDDWSEDDWSEDDWEDGDDGWGGGGFSIGGRGIVAIVIAVACWMWVKLYTPVALIVAAMSQSFLQTLKPWIGLGTIQRIGRMYGELLVFYGIIIGVQWLLLQGLSFIPFVGIFLTGFVDAYAWLCIGCLLGMVVEKKAEDLGLE